MIEETGLNNSIRKCEYYADLNKKTIDSINNTLGRLNRLYGSNNNTKIDKKIYKLNQESKTIVDNNDKYVYVLQHTLENYKLEAKHYSDNFETLGDM